MQLSKLIFSVCIWCSTMLSAQSGRPVGINLSGVSDYSTELVFADAMKQCREWIAFNADGSGPWDTGFEVPLSTGGYPLQIPYSDGIHPPQKLRTLVLWDLPPESFPHGLYRLVVTGKGQIRLRFGATGIYDAPVDTLVSATGGVAIEVERSDSSDPITQIQFILPAYVLSKPTPTFTTEFLRFLDDFECLRFMDWLRTNFSPVSQWGERSAATHYTQASSKGVAWEYVVELCNETQKDLWINIPHKAGDEYILQLAKLLQNLLNPALKIYLEYSNEVWNSAFSQHREAASLAASLGFSGTEWERAWKYTAKRSADIFHLFNAVFTDDSRLVHLIPTQAGNAWVSNQLLSFFADSLYNPHGSVAHALTIAPYFGGGVADEIVSRGLVASITPQEIVDRMKQSLANSYMSMLENKAVALKFGLDLNVYEGGQHLVATGANVNIDALTEKLNAANHHPDLQEAYCQYFDHWYENHGGLFMHFSSHGRYSKWGSWGIKETMVDSLNPKYLALKKCVSGKATHTSANPFREGAVLIYPNPSSHGSFYANARVPIVSLDVFGMTGRPVECQREKLADHIWQISIASPGLYIVKINGIARKVYVF
ncbi:MAG: T9SS type A sorting domain-containing protein [Saprospiraceae bacterium]|nr:T9SS type A sorting domain-containing protein [Saprospiraceae bacterium]